jgi:hypothetical protein
MIMRSRLNIVAEASEARTTPDARRLRVGQKDKFSDLPNPETYLNTQRCLVLRFPEEN